MNNTEICCKSSRQRQFKPDIRLLEIKSNFRKLKNWVHFKTKLVTPCLFTQEENGRKELKAINVLTASTEFWGRCLWAFGFIMLLLPLSYSISWHQLYLQNRKSCQLMEVGWVQAIKNGFKVKSKIKVNQIMTNQLLKSWLKWLKLFL